MSYIHIVQPY